MLTLADLQSVLSWTWSAALFVIGLGLIVFVHELGHFLVAKWVGIRVERFALGFGPRLFGKIKGETDYCVNLLPLGGYVKMLGQEDIKPDEASAGDPRSWGNKSVGARLAVVSAGVAMNIVFAAILFCIVALVGVNASAPIVGVAQMGSPASDAAIQWAKGGAGDGNDRGLKPGDHITHVDGPGLMMKLVGKDVTTFSKLQLVGMLAAPGDEYALAFQREVNGQIRKGTARMKIGQVLSKQGIPRPGFGIGAAADLTIDREGSDLIISSPFQSKDRVLAIDGQTVQHAWDIPEIAKTLTGADVNVTVRRGEANVLVPVTPRLEFQPDRTIYYLKDGRCIETRDLSETKKADGNDETITVKALDGALVSFPASDVAGGDGAKQLLDVLGLVPRTSVGALLEGSPAQKAGLRPGDVVVNYADRGAPTFPSLLEINKQIAGTGANILVLRDGNLVGPIWIAPKPHEKQIQIGMQPNKDLAHLVPAAVREGSPAQKAGILAGDTVEKVNDRAVKTWNDLYAALLAFQGKDVTLTFRRGEQVHTADLGTLDNSKFNPADYAFEIPIEDFKPLQLKMIQPNPLRALAWGVDQTWEWIIMTYASLRQMANGNVTSDDMMGPVGLGHVAIVTARRGFMEFAFLMAIISATLAVMNFLPIPVVDGGHAVFLIIEKIHGKPLPPRIVYVVQLVGFIALILAFVLLTWNDILRIVRGLW